MLLLSKYKKKLLKFILVFDLLVCKKPNDLLKQHMNNKSSDKNEFYLTINLLYPKEESLQFFFLKIIFFKLFVGILPLKM